MTQRSTPQKKIDDQAFPVRVLLEVPEEGFGKRLDEARAWLDTNIGRGEYAWHAAGRGTSDLRMIYRSAVYFRTAQHAAAFTEEFSDLPLADGTTAKTYSSPTFPFGRR